MRVGNRALVLSALTAVTLAVGAAPPALACANLVCAGSDDRTGSISASASYVTISVRGGSYRSSSGPVEVPNRVPPPCWYSKGRSGAEMAADSVDPYYRRLAHNVGEDYDEWFPDDAAAHATEDGAWWHWQCSSANFDGPLSEFFDYVDQWARDNQGPVWVPAGQAPPQPPVPTEILMGLARQVLEDAVRMPVVSFDPAERAVVRLETWMWFDPAAWQPISVTASGGGNSVTVTATPSRVRVGGLPAGSAAETACAGGGVPYAPGAGGTDCSITFGRASGDQPGQQWSFQVALSWDVTATAPLIGPAVLTRAEDRSLYVLESQTVTGGN